MKASVEEVCEAGQQIHCSIGSEQQAGCKQEVLFDNDVLVCYACS
jgi:hypothetical protein